MSSGAAVPTSGSRPADVAEVAKLQRQRLAAFPLALDTACRDVETLQGMVATLSAGFDLQPAERHELDQIALRLLDAREVLER